MASVEIGSSAEHGSSISSTCGSHGDRPRDAQPLLLTAGQAGAGLVQPVLDLVPQVGAAQRLLDDLVELAFVLARR